ncbi:hypothetical protein MSAN_01378900 [Mycena sanguinolenta]|uniref:DUF6697 domain-containing protein n=1 Tax=Mycena sanguinolenta TaxID=230812 RepID=A0A8H6Y7H8_9AGAR|nr:hypothetical protein MSAN_01378900 [Mycena sanguinolenta]
MRKNRAKVEIEAEELMDVDGPNIDQVNIESPLANPAEDGNEERDIPRTPPPDNGTGVDALFRIQGSSVPPAEFDAGGDVQMTTPDAEVERAVTVTPQQVTVKEEPVDMDIDSVLSSTEMPRPEKRRRILLDAVVIPFDRTARAHADTDRQVRGGLERQALHDKFELLKNPKVKKPKNTPVLSLDTVMARLQADKIDLEPYPIDLEPEIRDVTVRRDFMTKEYGGNGQETYPKIAEKFWKKTGMRNFMYLNLNFNPRCPEIPGAPGLLFDADCPEDSDSDLPESDDEDEAGTVEDCKQKVMKGKVNDLDTDEKDKKTSDKDRTEILFARLGQSMWQYQGQYILNPVNNLTVDEWKQQPNNVRRTWAQQLSFKGWGRDIRAQIALQRELGRKPTKAEKKNALKDVDNKFLTVTPEEISTAFDRGEVIIVVSTMKCVGYNSDFQRALAEKMPLFVPPPRKAKKASSKSKPKPDVKPASIKREGASPSTSRSKKRTRKELEDHDDFEDDSDIVPESEDESESPREIYRPRGTRSRPIVLS